MSVSLTRTGTAALVGVASGALQPPTLRPVMLGGQAISWAAIAEALALVGGGLVQFMSPYTMPNLVDGLVDGGAALLVRRGTVFAMTRMSPAGVGGAGYMLAGGQVVDGMPYALPSFNGGRAQVGSIGNLPKRTLT